MNPTRISTQVSVKHCSLCQGDTEYYCYGCRQDLCIQCKKLHVIDLGSKNHKVTSYAEKMKYPQKQVKNSQSQDPKQVKRLQSGDPKNVISARSQDPDIHEPCVVPVTEHRSHEFLPPVWLSPLEHSGREHVIYARCQDPDNDGECAVPLPEHRFRKSFPLPAPVWLSPLEHSKIERKRYQNKIYHLRGEILYNGIILEVLRYDLKTGHKACAITNQCQCYVKVWGEELKKQIDHVLAGDLKDRCIIQKTRMTRLLMDYHSYEHLRKTMETRPVKFLRKMTRKDNMKKRIMNMLGNLLLGIQIVPSGIPRRAIRDENVLTTMMSQYSDRIHYLKSETIYYRSILLEGLRYDRKTGHKAVTIRGQCKAEMMGQGMKYLIDEVLAGDLEDRCIIQKTRMTRHMSNLLRYYHRFEQLGKTRPVKFLRIMTQKHSPRKDDMKPIITMVVNLMKEIRLVPSGIPRRAGDEDLLTLLSSPVLQKSLSVTGVEECYHISCMTSDRVWVSDRNNIILSDTGTGEKLHSVEHSLYSELGIHTVNCEGELIYIDKKHNIIKLCNDMKTTTTLIKHTDTTWEPRCVYCSPSSGDLLVGMWRKDTQTGKVMRYDNIGKHKQTISHDDSTPHGLYKFPWFITENNNGDVLVSDASRRAVVVTSRKGVHCFTYIGPPSGSRLFYPRGICTDLMSHILVSDHYTATVQMLDRDGQFLSYVLTRQTSGKEFRPHSLSYEVYTHTVWVGAEFKNRIYKLRYINRHLHLTDEEEQHDDFDEGQTHCLR